MRRNNVTRWWWIVLVSGVSLLFVFFTGDVIKNFFHHLKPLDAHTNTTTCLKVCHSKAYLLIAKDEPT